MKRWIGLLLVLTLYSCSQSSDTKPLNTLSIVEESSAFLLEDIEKEVYTQSSQEYLADLNAGIWLGTVSDNFIDALDTGNYSYGEMSNVMKIGDYFLFYHAASDKDSLYHLDYCKTDGSDYNTLIYSQRAINALVIRNQNTLFLGMAPLYPTYPIRLTYPEYIGCSIDIFSGEISNIQIIDPSSMIINSSSTDSSILWYQSIPYVWGIGTIDYDGFNYLNGSIFSISNTGEADLIQERIRSPLCLDSQILYYQQLGDPTIYALDLSSGKKNEIISLDENYIRFTVDGQFLCYHKTLGEIVLFDMETGRELYRYENIGEVSYGSKGLLVTDHGFYISGSTPGDGGALDYYAFDGGKTRMIEHQFVDYFVEPDGIYFVQYLPHTVPGEYPILGRIDNNTGELIWLA